jgi:Protein of unknown function (DUF3054)
MHCKNMGEYSLKILSLTSRFSWFACFMDAVILFLFIWIGLQQHEMITSDWYPLLAVLPFWFSWIITGWLGGAFDISTEMSNRERMIRLLFSWIVALGIALLLRNMIFDKQVISVFALIAFLFNGGLFSLWRILFTRWYVLPSLK